jgi:hypothetical protein
MTAAALSSHTGTAAPVRDRRCSMRIKCPHCKHDARIRTSRPLSDITVEHTLQCQNVNCAHTWVALTSAVRTIAPSMCPNPAVYLQRATRGPSASKAANDAASSQQRLALDDTDNPRAAVMNSS